MPATVDYRKAPIDRVNAELTARWLYVYLVLALHPRDPQHLAATRELHRWERWLQEADERELRRRAAELADLFEAEIRGSRTSLPPRKSWRKIADDFAVIYRAADFDWTKGLAMGWVAERFDLSRFGYYEFPYHGRLGIWDHAGVGAVEENLILKDAFLMLSKAKQADRGLRRANERSKREVETQNQHDAFMNIMRSLNADVCAYSRLAVVSLYAFVEAFVNSVAEDFVARHPGLSQEMTASLQGFTVGKNGKRRYLPIEDKLQHFPGVIRGTRKVYITVNDPAQIIEPYASFVGHLKAVRDASSHYSIHKANIWLPPHKWLSTAEWTAKTCLAVASGFWSACYPERPQPEYLYGLDFQVVSADAENRLSNEKWAAE